MRVETLLERSAGRDPSKVAIVCGAERRTYAELDRQANGIAHALIERGVQPGDRVLVDLGNSIDAVASIFGALKAGAVFVVVHPQAQPDHVKRIASDCDARLTLSRRPGVPVSADTFELPAHSDANELAALVYTSGSTGHPKGVMLTHRNLTFAAAAISGYLGNTPDDVILNALPLAFTYGLGQITTAFHAGATVVLELSMTYPRAIVDSIVRERVTGLPLVPTMAALLLQQNLADLRRSRLRYITNAAAPMPLATIDRLRQTLPGARIFSMYGQTECQRASYLPPEQLDAHPESVGVPLPGTSAWVADADGRRMPPGVTGELVVCGPHVMKGYWNQPEATARSIVASESPDARILRTGDLFRQDADGLLYFVARTDDVIKTRGEKVAPRAIEEVIARLPGVEDVCVFGLPDELLGEAVAAAVKPAPGAVLEPDGIRRHCLRHLGALMVPKIVQIRASLPTTTTGKVSRLLLRASIERGEACA